MMNKNIVAVGVLTLAFGISNLEASKPFCPKIYNSEAFQTIVYKQDIKELPEDVKKLVRNANQDDIDQTFVACLYFFGPHLYCSDDDNRCASLLLVRELLNRKGKKPNLKKNAWVMRMWNREERGSYCWFALSELDKQFFNHLPDFGFANQEEFTELTEIQQPPLLAWIGWKIFG